MSKILLKIFKWISVIVITLLMVGGGVLIYFVDKTELSDCAFSPRDQVIVLDKKTVEGQEYTLVHIGGGSWQDKEYEFNIYRGPVKFDECGKANLPPIWSEVDSNPDKCPKSVRFNARESRLIYAKEGEKCIPSKEIKFEF